MYKSGINNRASQVASRISLVSIASNVSGNIVMKKQMCKAKIMNATSLLPMIVAEFNIYHSSKLNMSSVAYQSQIYFLRYTSM